MKHDNELVTSIRAMFLASWGMNSDQADARMSSLNYSEAVAAMAPLAPLGTIGSAWAGGIYAGVSRGIDGAPDQHLVLITGGAVDVSWDAAGVWAASVGGSLPTRREQRLLMANLPDHFEPHWYWSGEPAGPSRAWGQDFFFGTQSDYGRWGGACARAVLRLPI